MPPFVSQGAISINGVQVTLQPSYRTHREVLNDFGIHVIGHREGAYQLPGGLMFWFPDFTRSANAPWHNSFRNGMDEIIESVNVNTEHLVGMGVGMMLDGFTRITFAKQGRPARYYYVGVYQLADGNDPYTKVYRKICDSFDINSIIENMA